MYDVNQIISVLRGLEYGFNNKKEIVEEINKYLSEEITYSEAKHLWQRNEEVNRLIEKRLTKNMSDLTTNNDSITLEKEIMYYGLDNNAPIMSGVTAQEQIPNPQGIMEEMLQHFLNEKNLAERKQRQSVRFGHGPICMVNMSCIHFGGAMDIKQVFDDVDLVLNTPNTYFNFLGDLSDNFIIPYFHKLSLNRKITIEEEKSVNKFFINKIAPRLLSVTRGNHEWEESTIGYDVLKNEIANTGSQAFYDKHENSFSVDVAGLEIPIKIRHSWSGYSLFNPTHGIERGMKQEPSIKIGIGGHIHRGSLLREFIYNNERKIAVLCGTYKYYDDYANENGFEKTDNSSANAIIIDPDSKYGYYLFNNVQDACRMMKLLLKDTQ